MTISLNEIENYIAMVNEADHGAALNCRQIQEIISWSRDSNVLQSLKKLKSDNRIIEPPDKNEPLNIVDKDGTVIVLQDKTILNFPRWLCHLLGLRHRCSHGVVVMPNGLILIQKRARLKDVSPGAFDVAVGGHVKDDDSYEETLFIEMGEELGFIKSDVSKTLEIGMYESNVMFPGFIFNSVEARKIYVVELLPGSFDRVKFEDKEVAGVYLCDEKEALETLSAENVGSGLKYSLPIYLKWKES